MKHISTLAFVLCGALLVISPFLYAYCAKIYVEALTDEFITYIAMATGISSIVMGYRIQVSKE